MKYIEKYANATDEELQRDGFLRGEEELPCIECGELTPFVDICSEARFCSDTCCNKFYAQFNKPLREEMV